jgi:hypothetical protein
LPLICSHKQKQESTTEARSHGEKQKKVGLSPGIGYGLYPKKDG